MIHLSELNYLADTVNAEIHKIIELKKNGPLITMTLDNESTISFTTRNKDFTVHNTMSEAVDYILERYREELNKTTLGKLLKDTNKHQNVDQIKNKIRKMERYY